MSYEHYTDLTFMEHKDYEKCGQCWKQKIIADVASEMKMAGKPFDIVAIFEEADIRWKATSLYQQVKSLLEDGLTIDEVEAIMEANGVSI